MQPLAEYRRFHQLAYSLMMFIDRTEQCRAHGGDSIESDPIDPRRIADHPAGETVVCPLLPLSGDSYFHMPWLIPPGTAGNDNFNIGSYLFFLNSPI